MFKPLYRSPGRTAWVFCVGCLFAFSQLPACHSDAKTPVDKAAETGPFTPTGCQFSVASEPKLEQWQHDHLASGDGAAHIRYVRVGVGGKPSSGDTAHTLAVAWQTDEGDFGTELRWGTDPEPSKWPAEHVAHGVTWITPKQSIGKNPERMHEAYVCGLDPATTYYYQVHAGSEVSDVYKVRTTPTDPKTTVQIGITGDSRGQQGNSWQLIQRRLMKRAVDIQLFSGDMVTIAQLDVQWENWLGKAWKDDAGNLLSLGQMPMAALHGNHENYTPLYFGNVVLPQDPVALPAYPERFFSINVGPVHIIGVDDQAIGRPSIDPGYADVLRTWLTADLADANAHRKERPWIIAMRHHPSYSSSNHGDDTDVLNSRKFFIPIWEKGKVDIEFAGHDHNYERSKALVAGDDIDHPKEVADGGTRYIVCAGSGAPAYGAGKSDFTAYSASYKDQGHLGVYGVLEASDKELRWHPYWVDADKDSEVEPVVVVTR